MPNPYRFILRSLCSSLTLFWLAGAPILTAEFDPKTPILALTTFPCWTNCCCCCCCWVRAARFKLAILANDNGLSKLSSNNCSSVGCCDADDCCGGCCGGCCCCCCCGGGAVADGVASLAVQLDWFGAWVVIWGWDLLVLFGLEDGELLFWPEDGGGSWRVIWLMAATNSWPESNIQIC